MTMNWDEGQLAFLHEMQHGTGHLMGRARAGAGKTTTLVEGIRHLPPNATKLVTAFNNEIAEELRRRLDGVPGVMVKTLHAVGLETIRLHRGGQVKVDRKRGRTHAKFAASAWKREQLSSGNGLEQRKQAHALTRKGRRYSDAEMDQIWKDITWNLTKLTDFVKNVQPPDKEAVAQIARNEGYTNPIVKAEDWADMVIDCLQRTVKEFEENHDLVDFSDMIYLPRKLNSPGATHEGLKPIPYDYVIVDECQDMGPGQLWLAQRALKPGGRMIIIGDEKQAIYGWRGADKHAMPRMQKELGATVVSMETTYRCATSIVEYVQQSVKGLDDLKPRPNAPVGRAEPRTCSDLLGPMGAQPGDFVLSRLNAPLVALATHYLSHGIPVTISGKDIGQGLEALIKESKARTNNALRSWIAKWLKSREQEIVGDHEDTVDIDTEALAKVRDTAATIRGLTFSQSSPASILMLLGRMFSNVDSADVITLSTVHKAKGRERDTVWVLDWTFMDRGKTQEGDNLYYVAATRARDELLLVWAPTDADVDVELTHTNGLRIGKDAGKGLTYR